MKLAVTKVIDTHTKGLSWGLLEVVGTVQQVLCSRRRLLRRGLEFHVCTINESFYTKKIWKLIYDPRIYIYIYIYIYREREREREIDRYRYIEIDIDIYWCTLFSNTSSVGWDFRIQPLHLSRVIKTTPQTNLLDMTQNIWWWSFISWALGNLNYIFIAITSSSTNTKAVVPVRVQSIG